MTHDGAGDHTGPHTAEVLVYERTVPAPPELAFACMTEPVHLAAFWGPAGTSTPVDGIVVELRPGGRFETLIVSDADGSTHLMRAVFTEVTPGRRLGWTEPDNGMTTTVTFRADGDARTAVRIEQRNAPPPLRDPAVRAGFTSSLDRFERYLRHHQNTTREN